MTETTTAPATANSITGVVPYLSVDGAVKAAELYKTGFGAEEVGRQPVDEQGRTMHIYLKIHGGAVMLCDFYPEHGYPFQPPQAFTMHLQVADPDAWWARATAAGLEVVTPLQKMFWGDRYGRLRDPFGLEWAFNEPGPGK